ncbi:SLAM family member 8 [Pelodytes ibericus]
MGYSSIQHTAVLVSATEITQVGGSLGAEERLSPKVPDGFNVREVSWRHGTLAEDTVASYSRGITETKYRTRFKGRVRLNSDFSLDIESLELGDTGKFTCQLVDTEGHTMSFKYQLTVWEAVVRPTVHVFWGNTDELGCSVILSCNSSRGSNVSYTWLVKGGNGDAVNMSYTLHDGGRLLSVVLEPTDLEMYYTCTVTNPVSQQQTVVAPGKSCQSGRTGMAVKVIPFIATSIALSFTVLTMCVVLSVRSKGKAVRKIRQPNVEIPEMEEAAVLQDEEAAAVQTGEAISLQNELAQPMQERPAEEATMLQDKGPMQH